MLESIVELDKSVFYFLNDLHSPLFDVAMSLFTRTEVWVVLFVAIIVSIVKLFHKKAILVVLSLVLVVLIADQFTNVIKESVGRLRPTHDPLMQDLVHFVKRKGGKFSYFSAHAANTFGVAMYLTMLFKNKTFGFVIFTWAVIASYTRIYLGLHFPGDILTGVAFGLLLGWAVYQLNLYIERRFLSLSFPRIAETQLPAKQSQIIMMLLVVVLFSTFLIADRLLKMDLIILH